jgi:hypothetical protein
MKSIHKKEVKYRNNTKHLLLIILFGLIYNISFSQISIDHTVFEDNADKYIGKKVTVTWLWYSEYSQKGPLYDGRTLRIFNNGPDFEDIHSLQYYNMTDYKFYCRTVKGTGNYKITLLIPKSISVNVPNVSEDRINVTGIVKSANKIEVTAITRTR